MEKRKFTRILFNADTTLRIGTMHISADLLDLSMKGALLELKADNIATIPQDATGTLDIRLNDATTHIIMAVAMAHQENHHIGLRCTTIDIDSASHLRRLVELNIGNMAILERELAALSIDTD